MKKLKNKVLAVIAAMTVLCMTLTGCGEKLVSADQTVSALFELAAKSNAAPMQELLGFESEADVRSAFFEEGADMELVDQLKDELTSAGVELSDEEVQELTDSMVAILDKVTYTAEITSEDKDTTVVTLKINGFSADEMTQIMIDAANTMMESVTEEDQIAIANGDNDLLTVYMKQYLDDFMSGLAAMEPNAEAVEVTVTCEKLSVDVSGKEKAAWLPSDMNAFSNDIAAAMFQ